MSVLKTAFVVNTVIGLIALYAIWATFGWLVTIGVCVASSVAQHFASQKLLAQVNE